MNKTNTKAVKPSASQIQLASQLETSVDPMVRLNGPYYEIKKNLLLADYDSMMASAQTEPDRIEAQDVLHRSMETLQHAYLSDIKTEISRHLGTHAIHVQVKSDTDSLYL